MSVPVGFNDEGLPMGIQILGPVEKDLSPPAGTHYQPTQRRGHCSQDGDCSRKLLRNLALKSTVSERAAKQIEIGGFSLKSNRR
jgi:hypothetical protein